jgi:hypothetical protein
MYYTIGVILFSFSCLLWTLSQLHSVCTILCLFALAIKLNCYLLAVAVRGT